MKDGFIKVGAVTPKIKVADVLYNSNLIIDEINKACENNVNLLVFPELCITGYTCSDLFLQETLLRNAKEALLNICKFTENRNIIVVVGLPYVVNNKLYNVVAFLNNGNILGMIPKTYLPNYNEFYEARHFNVGNKKPIDVKIGGQIVPFGTNIIFECEKMEEFTICAEICEDLWVPLPPSTFHTLAGATIVCNSSASDETTVKENYRRSLISNQSARTLSAYIYADAGDGESTTDVVYSGHNIIAENGTILKEAERFKNQTIYGIIDVYKLISERRRMTTFLTNNDEYKRVYFSMNINETDIKDRYFSKTPFIPVNELDRKKRCEEIIMIQAVGLKKRLEHTNVKSVTIGISGGLDSTLAVLVTAKAFDMLNIDRKNIICVTMPCYGTTDRTYNNAIKLVNSLNATLKEINIRKAVEQHFKDIGHNENVHDVTYENSQARERTQILMDIAGEYNGFVVGTGDMSELALGWATYNGDHMSMYAVNTSVPKTLVRHLVKYFVDMTDNQELKEVLIDVLDTPVSPELLPPTENGLISQKTEDIVGPYKLHDFFLYYIMRFGFSPKKLYRIATKTFEDEFDSQTILKWLKKFYWRFFSQQFKRSCIPDGPKVGSVALSPRGDLRMPSDASVNIWISELEEI